MKVFPWILCVLLAAVAVLQQASIRESKRSHDAFVAAHRRSDSTMAVVTDSIASELTVQRLAMITDSAADHEARSRIPSAREVVDSLRHRLGTDTTRALVLALDSAHAGLELQLTRALDVDSTALIDARAATRTAQALADSYKARLDSCNAHIEKAPDPPPRPGWARRVLTAGGGAAAGAALGGPLGAAIGAVVGVVAGGS